MDWQTFMMLITDALAIITLFAMLVPPLRKRLLGMKAIEEGIKSTLRQEIVKIYYRNLATKTLRQYEYESLCACYEAYIALGGNSFVKHIFEEMQDWKVIH